MSAFATLEPLNLQAKLDFDHVAHRLTDQAKGKNLNAYIHVLPQQIYDPEVFRSRNRRIDPSLDLDDFSATSTEVDTDIEDETRPTGLIWTGYYSLSFSACPTDPKVGWVAGRGSMNDEHNVELLLGVLNKHNDVRGRHIICM
jgi:hypothetical protein